MHAKHQPTPGHTVRLPTNFSGPPPAENFIASAKGLERNTRIEKRPYVLRLCMAWLAAVVITIFLGLLTYVVLEGTLNLPVTIAFGLAVIFQFAAIFAFHAWVDGQHRGERPLNIKLAWVIIFSGIMIALAYRRSQLFLEEEMEIAPLAVHAISAIISLIEPVISWVTGAMTAGAGQAAALPTDMVRRARQHMDAISVQPNTQAWKASVDQAKKDRREAEAQLSETTLEREQVASVNHATGSVEQKAQRSRLKHLDEEKARRELLVKHLNRWLHKLELFMPDKDALD